MSLKDRFIFCLLPVLMAGTSIVSGQTDTIDIASLDADSGEMLRVFGPPGNIGQRGVPVGGGGDFDGDGNEEIAIGWMTTPLSVFGTTPVVTSSSDRNQAGLVGVLFGSGEVSGTYNAARPDEDILIIQGSQTQEILGTELWFADVTNDGFADLVICSQNYSPPGRRGAGSLTIIPGGPHVREFARDLKVLDMNNPDPDLPFIRVWGRAQDDRFGQWMRFADVDGDGVSDIIAGADQADQKGFNSGEAWVIRGGDHITTATPVVDLSLHTTSGVLQGNVARILPPSIPALNNGLHFGSTIFGGDADGNGRAEIAISCALNRSGAGLRPVGASGATHQASGGASGGGSAIIVWDDNFPEAPWPNGFEIDLDVPDGGLTIINGAGTNPSSPYYRMTSFGEELAIGVDFNNDGKGDFYAADLVGTTRGRSNGGVGVVFYDIEQYRNQLIDLDNVSTLPGGAQTTIIEGPIAGAIGNDTIAIGDFNGDSIDDLVIGNPKDAPNGRSSGGTLHILYGQNSVWPPFIDTSVANLPATNDGVRILLLQGGQTGDVLIYSASYGDIDGDGITDIITNEMEGNNEIEDPSENLFGPWTNVGNLVVFSGAALSENIPTNEIPQEDRWIIE